MLRSVTYQCTMREVPLKILELFRSLSRSTWLRMEMWGCPLQKLLESEKILRCWHCHERNTWLETFRAKDISLKKDITYAILRLLRKALEGFISELHIIIIISDLFSLRFFFYLLRLLPDKANFKIKVLISCYSLRFLTISCYSIVYVWK